MNTAHTEKTAPSAPLEELRTAILETAFIRASDGVRIVGDENTGKRDQWIFDFRALMLQPKWLDRFAELFWERFGSRYPFQVSGVETAGIPLVAAIVMKSVERGTPVNGFYLRKSRKRQGLMKYIEGTVTDDPVIFVDDLINSGSSLRKQLDILAREGARVTDAFVMLAFREDEAYAFLQEKGVGLSHFFTLADFNQPMLREPAVKSKESFEVVWRYGAPDPSFHLVVHKSAPLLGETLLYFGCDDGIFRALDRTSGILAWEFKIGRHPAGKGILSSPALHDGHVFFGAYDGNIYALDALSGAVVWVNREAEWVGSSPAVAPDIGMLFIGLEFGFWKQRGGVAALDLKSGATKWIAHHTSLTHGSPLYIPEESLVVIGSNDGVLYAYDAATGAPRWSFATGRDIKMRPAYDAQRRSIVCASMSGSVYSLSARDGIPLIAYETAGAIYSSPLVLDNTIYVASLDKCVYAIAADTGALRWSYETSGRIFASPVIVGMSLCVGSNDGRLYELDKTTGSLIAVFQASERIISDIAHRDGQFFVPTVANEIYCIQKKTRRE